MREYFDSWWICMNDVQLVSRGPVVFTVIYCCI